MNEQPELPTLSQIVDLVLTSPEPHLLLIASNGYGISCPLEQDHPTEILDAAPAPPEGTCWSVVAFMVHGTARPLVSGDTIAPPPEPSRITLGYAASLTDSASMVLTLDGVLTECPEGPLHDAVHEFLAASYATLD
jgi:hypothetical protein